MCRAHFVIQLCACTGLVMGGHLLLLNTRVCVDAQFAPWVFCLVLEAPHTFCAIFDSSQSCQPTEAVLCWPAVCCRSCGLPLHSRIHVCTQVATRGTTPTVSTDAQCPSATGTAQHAGSSAGNRHSSSSSRQRRLRRRRVPGSSGETAAAAAEAGSSSSGGGSGVCRVLLLGRM